MTRATGQVVVVMGVCGAGKSRVAADLAHALGGAFVEADSFHSEVSKQRMQRGEALTDADRLPWLRLVAQAAQDARSTGRRPVVVACSALKRSYRDLLRGELGDVLFVHLTGTLALIRERLEQRQGHFVGEALLDSQLATLEPLERDEAGMEVDVSNPVRTIVRAVMDVLPEGEPAATHGAAGQVL